MGPSGTFELKGLSRLQIDHRLDEHAELTIWFQGDMIVRRGERFRRYLDRLEDLVSLSNETPARHVHCHLEDLGEALSRAQHAIYRMLNAMRGHGIPITIYATGERPEQSEHLKMAKLFVQGLSKQPGPSLELVEIRRQAS